MGDLPTEATIAYVLVCKYTDHLPLYRQSQILTRAGLDLHSEVLAIWVELHRLTGRHWHDQPRRTLCPPQGHLNRDGQQPPTKPPR